MANNVLSYATPPTVRLGFIARLIIWLAQPFDRPTRRVPYACVILITWGSGSPGWVAPTLCIGIALWCFYLVGIFISLLAARWVRRWEIPVPTLLNEPQNFRRLGLMLLMTMVILAVRPMLYLNFWISKPWLDRQAAAVLSEPFSTPVRGPVESHSLDGVFQLTDISRCPHGVALFVTHAPYHDRGAGFFYRVEPGNCSRFRIDRYLGGNWYSFDN